MCVKRSDRIVAHNTSVIRVILTYYTEDPGSHSEKHIDSHVRSIIRDTFCFTWTNFTNYTVSTPRRVGLTIQTAVTSHIAHAWLHEACWTPWPIGSTGGRFTFTLHKLFAMPVLPAIMRHFTGYPSNPPAKGEVAPAWGLALRKEASR